MSNSLEMPIQVINMADAPYVESQVVHAEIYIFASLLTPRLPSSKLPFYAYALLCHSLAACVSPVYSPLLILTIEGLTRPDENDSPIGHKSRPKREERDRPSHSESGKADLQETIGLDWPSLDWIGLDWIEIEFGGPCYYVALPCDPCDSPFLHPPMLLSSPS